MSGLAGIPVPRAPWSEVHPGLWVGGHLSGDCHPGDAFDLVVSLFDGGPEYRPTRGDHVLYAFEDADLDTVHHQTLDYLASLVVDAVQAEKRVLVRCAAGVNRSALVAALALIRLGHTPGQSIHMLRARRSPYALCNPSFEAHVWDAA